MQFCRWAYQNVSSIADVSLKTGIIRKEAVFLPLKTARLGDVTYRFKETKAANNTVSSTTFPLTDELFNPGIWRMELLTGHQNLANWSIWVWWLAITASISRGTNTW